MGDGRQAAGANIPTFMRVYHGVTGEMVGLAAPAAATGAVDPNVRLAELFDRHHHRLYRLARRLTATVDDARDAVQETFVRLATSRTAVPAAASAEEAWLVRVLVNVCRDEWRRRARRAPHDARHAAGVHIAAAPDVERALVARHTVWRALDALTPRRRAVLVLYELEGATMADIAQLLGMSRVTVRWHLSRGRRELANVIERSEKK